MAPSRLSDPRARRNCAASPSRAPKASGPTRNGLLVLIVVANAANLSLFSSAIPGPEEWLAGRPLVLVTLIFVQIVVTLTLVGVLARRPEPEPPA